MTWHKESYRHHLAAKGISTNRYYATKDYLKGNRRSGLDHAAYAKGISNFHPKAKQKRKFSDEEIANYVQSGVGVEQSTTDAFEESEPETIEQPVEQQVEVKKQQTQQTVAPVVAQTAIAPVVAQEPVSIIPSAADILPVTSTLNQDLGHEL